MGRASIIALTMGGSSHLWETPMGEEIDEFFYLNRALRRAQRIAEGARLLNMHGLEKILQEIVNDLGSAKDAIYKARGNQVR